MIAKMTRVLVASALGVALFATSAAATPPQATAAPAAEITVTKEAKLVKNGTAAMIEGEYSCTGGPVDIHVDVDQKGHAAGKGKGANQACTKAERAAGKKKWKVTVPVQSRGGLFIAASAYVSVRLCGAGSVNIFASLNLWVSLRF